MQNLASASYNSSFFLDVFGLFASALCAVPVPDSAPVLIVNRHLFEREYS